jgi:hypothetical protein
MKFLKVREVRNALLSILLMLSACASVTSGTTQFIKVDTDPSGAVCVFTQGDIVLGERKTPMTISISRSKDDLVFDCYLDGYQPRHLIDKSLFTPQLETSLSAAIDSATGAIRQYPSPLLITMQKKQ